MPAPALVLLALMGLLVLTDIVERRPGAAFVMVFLAAAYVLGWALVYAWRP